MKNLMTFFKVLLALLVISQVMVSCKTSDDVVSNKWIQKRKYNKGFYVNNPINKKKETAPVTDELAENKAETAEHKSDSKTSAEAYLEKAANKQPNQTDLLSSNKGTEPSKTKSVNEPKLTTIESSVDDEFKLQSPSIGPGSSFESPNSITDTQSSDVMAILGFVFGLLSLLLCWSIAGPLLALLGIIFSLIGWDGGNTLAVLGLVFSIITLLLYVVVFLLILAILL